MNNESLLNKKIINGFFWKFGERILAQGITFIISIILARLLLPKEYGLIALLLVFINIANVFVSDGLGSGLIQKRNTDETDFSTMFFVSVGFSLILYFALFVSAPFISSFYNNGSLTTVIRVISIQIPLSGIKTIQHAYVSKNMLFRKFFFSTLIGTIVSGVIAIIMAYNGFGIWALVEQYIVNTFLDVLVLFISVKWRPSFKFSVASAKTQLNYSWKLLAASLINTIYVESRSLIIGKLYSESELAYSTKGNQFPSLFINNIDSSISAVLFPALSSVNDKQERIKQMTKASLKTATFFLFPLLLGLFAIADNLVVVLLTDKWVGCVPFLRLACLYFLFQPCLTANNQALKASGKSNLCLTLEIIKKIIGFGLLFLTMRISVLALAVSSVIFAFISMIINIFPNRNVIKYGYFEQFKDMFPQLTIAIFMSVCVYFLSVFPLPVFIVLVLQIVFGIVFYFFLAWLFRIDGFYILLNLLKSIRKAK